MKRNSLVEFFEGRGAIVWAVGRFAGLAGLVGLAITSATFVGAQTNLLKIDYEWASSVGGPWTKPPLDRTYVQPDGSLLTLASEGQMHFRLAIQEIDFDDVLTPSVHVVKLRDETVSIAESHLSWLASNFYQDGRDNPEGQAWSEAELAPVAYQVFDASYQDGKQPAYIEFKVIPKADGASGPIGFLENKDDPVVSDLGYILVSLQDGDAPVAQFSQEGSTPCEHLLRRAKATSNVKILRYGPTYLAVENEKGELLANLGGDPYRLPEDLFRTERTYEGTFESELAEGPPRDGYGGPKLNAAPYRSYEEFKSDYINSPVYQEFRRRKAEAVAGEWVLLRGGTVPAPPVISVQVGQWIHAFESLTVTRYFLDDDEPQAIPLATIDDNTGGDGLAIRGERVGAAPFTVEIGGKATQYELQVTAAGMPADGANFQAAGAGFTPGWQPFQTWPAGNWSEQPRYWQTLDYDRWCPKVGCGPVAWAILLAWWDRHGVPACFYSNPLTDLTAVDAPFRLTEDFLKMRAVYRDLHDYCDVVCWGAFSSQGTTFPGDMVEAGPTFLWTPKQLGRLEYKYVWAYNTADPGWGQPSSRIRYANKTGRPALAGWYWHYGVSYAYMERVYKLTPSGPVLARRRYFRCNMGSSSEYADWRNGNDMIFGAYLIPTQK